MSLIQAGSRDALRHAAPVVVSALIALALAGPATAGARGRRASAGVSGTAQSEPMAPAIAQEPPSRSEAAVGYSVGPISDVSGGCPETGALSFSTDGGQVFAAPVSVVTDEDAP